MSDAFPALIPAIGILALFLFFYWLHLSRRRQLEAKTAAQFEFHLKEIDRQNSALERQGAALERIAFVLENKAEPSAQQ